MITIILSGVKCYLLSKETLILSFHIELYFVGLLFTSYKQFFIFVTEGVKTQKREDVKTPLVVGGIKIIYCPNFQLFYKMSLECIISWRKCAQMFFIFFHNVTAFLTLLNVYKFPTEITPKLRAWQKFNMGHRPRLLL